MWEKTRRCPQKIPRGHSKPKIKEHTMDKRTNNDVHNTTQKFRATRISQQRGWTQLISKSYQFLLHYWIPSCYSGYNACDKPHNLWLLLQDYVSTRKGLCGVDKGGIRLAFSSGEYTPTNMYSISNSTKVVFNLPTVWHSPNTIDVRLPVL